MYNVHRKIASVKDKASAGAALGTLKKFAGKVALPNLKDVKDRKSVLNKWWNDNKITATSSPLNLYTGEQIPKDK